MNLANTRNPYSYGQGSMYRGKFYPFALMGGAGPNDQGYHDVRDIVLADGIVFREVVAEIDAALAEITNRRDEVLQRLVYETTEPAIRVRHAGGVIRFEQGSEYGTPGIQRTQRTFSTVGLPIKQYKVMTGWTREYLANQTADELRIELTDYVKADSELLWQLAFQALFDNLAGTTYTFPDTKVGDLIVRAPLYNGDNLVPPPYNHVTFTAPHDHYMVSGGLSLTMANVTALNTALTEHGHTSNKILFIHQDQEDDIRALPDFYAPLDPNVVDPLAVYSKVGAPYIGVIRGLDLKVRRWDLLPTGYCLAMNDYGVGSTQNPVARREFPAGHNLRGLQLFRPNPDTIYPVEQTFYERWVGFGSNQRSNGAIMKVTTGGYTVPSILQLREG